MTTVTIFNTGLAAFTLSLNNGMQYAIPGVSPDTFTPQGSAPGDFSWGGTFPEPGSLGPDRNMLVLTPAGSPNPLEFGISLPEGIQWTSVQIHLFFAPRTIAWVALNQGQYVTGNILQLDGLALDADAPVQIA